MSSPTLEARNLCKSFGPVRANHDISFTVDSGELLCLFGENGAGKSTLSACLTGLFPPDSGDILFKGASLKMASAADAIRQGIGLVHQHFVLVPDFTVLENIVIGSERGLIVQYDEAEKKLRQICDSYGIEINPNALVRDLSVGERQWAELLKALYFDADVLILDEPTATLDVENSKKLFRIIDKLKADGVALILISHFLDEVMQADRVAVLRQGKVVGIRSTTETTPEELTRLMVGRDLEVKVRDKTPTGPPWLVLKNVTVAGTGQVPDLDNVSLTVHQGEIFGIAGVAGNGQNPLMEVIAGVRTPAGGQIMLDDTDIGGMSARVIKDMGLGHIPDDRFLEGLVPEMSIEENLILGDHRGTYVRKAFLDFPKIRDTAIRMINEFQISAPSPETPTENLSGGNAQRVILAREKRLATKVLLANQPTRGLDVGVIEYIHTRLLEKRAEGVAVLIASSELEDLMKLCDRIGVLFQGRLMGVVETDTTNLEEIGLLMAGRASEVTA
ncbi:ABC transporter ATP-binding protein [Coralliovum pocilloporae]|uniref:ABC transporter ATP-binding protein n=1 Tax=Coralliovum pocilloporae TaxID=3066369 RepID=UPI0033078163